MSLRVRRTALTLTLLAALAGGCDDAASGAVDAGSRANVLTFDADGVHRAATSASATGPYGTDPAIFEIRAIDTAFEIDIFLFLSTPFAPGSYSCSSGNGTFLYGETGSGLPHSAEFRPCTVTFTDTDMAGGGWVTGTFSSLLEGTTTEITNGAFDLRRQPSP